ncbi:MAG: restriction endonuclease [Candidatus Baltobacteraceae bacterium]
MGFGLREQWSRSYDANPRRAPSAAISSTGTTINIAPDIQQFARSMEERRADEGVFVTTSDFTGPAMESVRRLHKKIVLINGQRLAEIMFELGVGVTTESIIHLKRLDLDFFTP